MPAFSHCFLKRFMAFSNDSPSLTRTPGIVESPPSAAHEGADDCAGLPRNRGHTGTPARNERGSIGLLARVSIDQTDQCVSGGLSATPGRAGGCRIGWRLAAGGWRLNNDLR